MSPSEKSSVSASTASIRRRLTFTRFGTLAMLLVLNAQHSAWDRPMADATTWKLRLATPPVDGKAHSALVDFMHEFLHLPKSAILIIRGKKSGATGMSGEFFKNLAWNSRN